MPRGPSSSGGGHRGGGSGSGGRGGGGHHGGGHHGGGYGGHHHHSGGPHYPRRPYYRYGYDYGYYGGPAYYGGWGYPLPTTAVLATLPPTAELVTVNQATLCAEVCNSGAVKASPLGTALCVESCLQGGLVSPVTQQAALWTGAL